MKLTLRHKLPAVLGASLLLTSGTGAIAYALVSESVPSPAGTGNGLPIDDNHPSRDVTAPDDRTQPTGTATDTRPSQAAEPEATHAPRAHRVRVAPSTRRSDDGARETAEPDDDVTPEPEHTAEHSSTTSTSGRSSGSGSDDATPEPRETEVPAADGDDHGGSSSGRSGGSGSGSGGGGSDDGGRDGSR